MLDFQLLSPFSAEYWTTLKKLICIISESLQLMLTGEKLIKKTFVSIKTLCKHINFLVDMFLMSLIKKIAQC